MNLTGEHFIAGQRSAQGGETFTSVNPRTRGAGDVHFHEATTAEIDRAVTAAADAFKITRDYSAAKLADFLDTAADEIEALGDGLLETADMETGLGIPRLTGERGRTTGQLRKFAALLREGSYVEAIIDSAQPYRQPAPRPDIRRMLVALGPVGVFSASNFPFAFAVPGGDTASAFAAGCPVIVKGHPGHPATSELFAQAITAAVEKSGFPAGFFSLIQGASNAVGSTLVKHPLLEAVGFTGSLGGGRALYDIAASRPRPIPVYAEMGSINPVVMLPDAIRTRADSLAEAFVGSVTLGSGQFCTNPGVVFVLDGPQTGAFIEKVSALMAAKEPGVLLNAKVQSGLQQAVAATIGGGLVQTLVGAAVVANEAYCYENSVLKTSAAEFIDNPALQTEHFGPVTLFVVCNSLDEMKAAIDSLDGNLTSTIHAEASEQETARELYGLLQDKAGRLIWNGFPTGVEVVASMQHGGPYPATTAPGTTSVGMTAIKRFMRPVAWQNLPDGLLPDALKNANPLGIWRTLDDVFTKDAIG